MNKKYLWIGAVVVVAGGALAMAASNRGKEELPEVQTAKVEHRKIIQKVNATGKIQPKTQVKISADVSSKIINLHVNEGDWVEAGQLLVELDSERYQAQVESAEANVRSVQANAKLVRENMLKTEKEFDRAHELVARKLESQSALDTMASAYQVEIARYESAQDQVEQAKAALKQARDALAKTTIYSPMAGTISALNKEKGEIAIGSQFQEDVIMIVADLSEMEAQVNVDENDIVAIQIGQHAEIEVDALLGQTLVGTVYEIANSANGVGAGSAEQKTEFEVRIAISSPGDSLRPGMTASADVFTKTNDAAVSVPIQSVAVRTVDQLAANSDDDSAASPEYVADKDGFVEVVFSVEDGKAVAKQVTTGIQSDSFIEIVTGLDVSEEIVTGSYRAISRDLANGAKVNINNSEKKEG